MIVTLFGFAGAGTSTTGRIIAERLELRFISTGDIFRAKARQIGVTIEQFDQLARSDRKHDRSLDDEVIRIGLEEENILVDSRLAWHFIPHSVKLKFNSDKTVRYSRVAEREGIGFEQAAEKTASRDDSIIERARKYYNLEHFWLDHNFDYVFDTTTATKETIADLAVDFISRREKCTENRWEPAALTAAAD